MHTNRKHLFKEYLQMAASLFSDTPLYFNGPEVPAVSEDPQQEKMDQPIDRRRETRPAAYRPEREQEERTQEETDLRKIESKMERSGPQESSEKNRELMKTLNEQLQRSFAAYPEGLKQNRMFKNVFSRFSLGEENGRTFIHWDAPEHVKSFVQTDMGKEMVQMLGGNKMEVVAGGAIRFYDTPENLKRSAERFMAMLSSGPVEETEEDRRRFDSDQRVGLRPTSLLQNGELAKELREDERTMQKVKEIKKNLHADFAKTRIGSVLINARFVTDGSKMMMVVPEKNAPEFRTMRKGMPNLFKGNLEKDKNGNYAMTVDERTTKNLLFMLADHTPQGGGIDWEAPEIQAFSKKYPDLVKHMQENRELSIPERDSIASMQQTQRVRQATR